MSMSAQGSDRLACVCRCSNGVFNASRPAIHILAGEKVCIQAISPMHCGSTFAAVTTRWMATGSVSTGFHSTGAGRPAVAFSVSTSARDCCSTRASVSGP